MPLSNSQFWNVVVAAPQTNDDGALVGLKLDRAIKVDDIISNGMVNPRKRSDNFCTVGCDARGTKMPSSGKYGQGIHHYVDASKITKIKTSESWVTDMGLQIPMCHMHAMHVIYTLTTS